MKRVLSIFMALILSLSAACGGAEGDFISESAMAETNMTKDAINEGPIELVVYSQLSGYRGEQQGWFAKVLLDKFNVKLSICDCGDAGSFEDRLESGFIGDIIIFGSTGEQYQIAVEKGILLDWEADDLLSTHGGYILENMSKALEYNRNLTPDAGKIFGFGQSVATSAKDVDDIFYTWDIRWDLYKQLGYPEVKDLSDLLSVLKSMKVIYPADEIGKETYALSIWPEWDAGMVMYVKAMASAYYGYDELGLGLYDSDTGEFYGALEENGPYLEMLAFFNELYREGMLDPASNSQTYDEAYNKMQSGGSFFSIFNYVGSLTYNSEEHIAENKYMASLFPGDATPAAYGMSVYGGNRVWTIGANSEHKELCMEISNWLCTPEGRLTCDYGPKGVTWDYDAEGNTYFTELGKKCYEDRLTEFPAEYGGGYFGDGYPMYNNVTWHYNAENPESNGETYNAQNWKRNIAPACCETEQDWREYTGCATALEYMKSEAYKVIPASHYKSAEKDENLQKIWEQVSNCIVTESWNAIYAGSEEEFEQIVANMISKAKAYGYEQCVDWCKREAGVRFALEEEARE